MNATSATLDLAECERVAVEIARKAGTLIKNTCGVIGSIETKLSFADLVTETDKNVESLVFECLRKSFPDHKFIGEESVAADNYGKVQLTDEPTWIVDPVDGTMNFVHTFPYVAVAIGLAVNKQPVLGVVYCPALDQMFTGRQGNGAYCNGKPIKVRISGSLQQSLVGAELGSDRSDAKRACVFNNMQAIGWRCHGLRSLGSAAMNVLAVAQGHLNAYFEYGLHCWDICAPSAILLEAGGYMCDTTGARPLDLLNRRLLVACNEQIARELTDALVDQLELDRD